MIQYQSERELLNEQSYLQGLEAKLLRQDEEDFSLSALLDVRRRLRYIKRQLNYRKPQEVFS
jgi:hypothetical protein